MRQEVAFDRAPSEERLNAFVDGELDGEDHAQMQRLVCEDAEVARAVCELRTVKELVRSAYVGVCPPGGRSYRLLPAPPRRGIRGIAAALALLAAGALAGWLARDALVEREISGLQAIALAPMAETRRIILHVSSNDPARFEAALDDTERLLRASRDEGRVVQVEIVANTEGLKLLRMAHAPYVARLRALARRYHNVRILACSRTIEKFRLMGVDIRLVPEAQVIPGALERIVDRLQQGWVYIKV